MRHFKAGSFDKERVPTALRRFSPNESLHSLEEVDLHALKAAGKRLILLDVDNTLLPWKSQEIPASTTAWLQAARDLGFELCILSNTRNPERLEKLCESMKVDFIRDKFKPNPKMYHLAMEKYKMSPADCVMIGDQLFTDIWGANRAGIDAIWVRPLGKKEFIGTKLVSRNGERVVGRLLYRYFQAEGADAEDRPGFFRHEVVQQLLKFALVGGTVTVIDRGIHALFMFGLSFNGKPLKETVGTWVINSFNLGWPLDAKHLSDAAYAPLMFPGTMIAILVSYLLNRTFTFQVTDRKITGKQVAQFYIVALIGMLISVFVGTVANRLADRNPVLDWVAGSAVGIVAGFIWNFNAQRLWTFKQK